MYARLVGSLYSLIQCHFWYWTKKQLFNFSLDKIHRTQNVCTLPSLHTLSEIIKNISQLEQIAVLIEKPSCHNAFCFFSFHAEQMDWLTHQFRQLIKGLWYKDKCPLISIFNLRRGAKKSGYFTVRLTVSKCEFFIFFSLKFDSLTLKTHIFSLWGASKMHFSCP